MDCKKLYEKYRACLLNNTFNGTYAFVECREKEMDYLKCKKKEEKVDICEDLIMDITTIIHEMPVIKN